MRNMWTIAFYEIRRMMTSRTVILVQFALPLLLIFLLGSALSGSFKTEDQDIKPVDVAWVQEDTGLFREHLEAFLTSSDIQEVIQVTQADSRAEAERLVTTGRKEFALIVPASFSSDITLGKPAQWEMILGNDYRQNLTAQIVFDAFLSKTNQMQAIFLTLGAEASAKLMNDSSITGTVSESLVKVGSLSTSNSNFTATQYYSAAMLIMFLLYSGMSAAISLKSEKEQHTLARLNAMPIQEVHIMAGKVIGNSFIALIQTFVIIGVTTWLYGVYWGGSYGLLFITCLFIILASMSLAVITCMVSDSTKAVTSLFQTIIIIMTFLSGGFSPWPEGWLQKLGEFTVNHWALQGMLRMMLENDTSLILNYVTVLGVIGCGLLLTSLAVYRKVGYHE